MPTYDPSRDRPAPTQQPTQQPAAPVDPVPNNGFDPNRRGTHDDFYRVYTSGSPTGSNVGGEGSFQTSDVDAQQLADWQKANPSHKYFTDEAVWSGGEGGSMTTQRNIDWGSMPNQGKTKFGQIGTQAATITSLDDVDDKNAVYFDPAYGWVTPKGNIKDNHNWFGKIGSNGALIASLAMGGLMGVGLPAGLMASGVKAGMGLLPSIGQGEFDPYKLAITAAGLGAGAMGVDPKLIAAGKIGAGMARGRG
jgi:hypothetical protein